MDKNLMLDYLKSALSAQDNAVRLIEEQPLTASFCFGESRAYLTSLLKMLERKTNE